MICTIQYALHLSQSLKELAAKYTHTSKCKYTQYFSKKASIFFIPLPPFPSIAENGHIVHENKKTEIFYNNQDFSFLLKISSYGWNSLKYVFAKMSFSASMASSAE